ncbi:MAG TPA: nuclear transport factor 2 family protein [Phycisphaerae bacterium]|nr:nuclear transport factor 2 family protein [Phycisphaerae bacterium]
MNTPAVAQKLVSLCQQGKFNEAMEATYASSIVSVEGFDMGSMPRETRGLDNVRKKAQWWEQNHTVHSCKVAGPFMALDKFAVTFDLDVTDKATGKRMQMSEVAVYTVEGDKIVHEEFLYKQ